MMRISEAIVVEGRYDRARLQAVTDALIVETDGFGIFRDREKLALLRRLAGTRGLIVLTDSDAAGFLIRDRLAGTIPPSQLKHAYIPEIPGKERRKSVPGKEGLLGVEGMDKTVLEAALRKAGATILGETRQELSPVVTKARLFEDGLSGTSGSAALRAHFLSRLGLPQKLSANRLLEVINATMTEEEYTAVLAACVESDTPLPFEKMAKTC